MRLKSVTAFVAAFVLCAATGCHLTGKGACSTCDAGPVGCDSCGGCTDGACGGLAGLLGKHLRGGSCGCSNNLAGQLKHSGPLADSLGRHHRGAQSHMGSMPGPASGPPVGQVTYPYYTTRGPRDFFADDPASIGP